MPTFPGVEAVLVEFLAGELGVRVCTELPADLGDVLPVVQVVRVGGGHDDNETSLQSPTLSVDVFARDRGAATSLAQDVDTTLRRRLPGQTILGASAGRVRTITGPAWRPWDDITLRRFGGTYQLWIRVPI